MDGDWGVVASVASSNASAEGVGVWAGVVDAYDNDGIGGWAGIEGNQYVESPSEDTIVAAVGVADEGVGHALVSNDLHMHQLPLDCVEMSDEAMARRQQVPVRTLLRFVRNPIETLRTLVVRFKRVVLPTRPEGPAPWKRRLHNTSATVRMTKAGPPLQACLVPLPSDTVYHVLALAPMP